MPNGDTVSLALIQFPAPFQDDLSRRRESEAIIPERQCGAVLAVEAIKGTEFPIQRKQINPQIPSEPSAVDGTVYQTFFELHQLVFTVITGIGELLITLYTVDSMNPDRKVFLLAPIRM